MARTDPRPRGLLSPRGFCVQFDPNAAGWGWFVDATPGDDSEFSTLGDQGELNRMDLLSVVMHELGHVFGMDHDEDGVMAETLAAGVRQTAPEHDHLSSVDQVFQDSDNHHADAWLAENLDSTGIWAKRRR